MYCPNCGKQTAPDQRFCRACGLGLEKIAQSLGEQCPERVDETLIARKERLERLGVAALGVFGLGLLSFLAYAIGQKLIAQGSLFAALVMIGVVIMLGSGLLSAILFARAKELGEEASKRQLPTNANAQNGLTKELLSEGNLEPVPTVTERTTELLFAEKPDKK